MSYDISLVKDGKPVTVDIHTEGGTYVLGGTTKAELNITYNYCKLFTQYFDKKDGIRWLYGRKARNTVRRLEKAVKALGTDQVSDYWRATKGNVGFALSILLKWAKQHMGATWEGD